MTMFTRLCLSFTVLICANADAAFIVVEPDSYAAGTNISDVSSLVSISSGSRQSVYAAPFSCSTRAAPTGTLVFGLSAAAGCHGWASQVGGPYPSGLGGDAFVLAFADSVSSLTVDVLNFGYPAEFSAQYAAYDENFNLLSSGFWPASLGEPTTITLSIPNVRYFDVGGVDGIAALVIDRISFEIPEPGTLGLMALGLLGVGMPRVAKFRSKGARYRGESSNQVVVCTASE